MKNLKKAENGSPRSPHTINPVFFLWGIGELLCSFLSYKGLIKNLPLQNNGIQTQKTRKKITKLEHFFV